MALDVVPTLTIDGFVSNRNSIMTKLFEYFLASDSNQSTMFYGKVTSLKAILKKENTPDKIEARIVSELKALYSNFYTSVDVLTEQETVTNENKMVTNIKVDITASYNEKIYTLSQDIQYSNADILTFDQQLADLYAAEKEGLQNYE